MFKRAVLALFLFLIFTGAGFAQNLRVNNQPVREGDSLNLFFENLEAGKIVFSLEAGQLKKAEITFDKGRTWSDMKQEGEYFVYGYRPLANEIFFPELLLTDKNQGVQTYRPNLRINYQKDRPDQQLVQFLEKFKTFYEDENKDRFLSLFSMTFPDRVKFEQAIQNDFYNYKNMRLFYRIDTRAFDDDLEGAIWNVYWQRKYQDRNGNDLAESSANIAMRFDKEAGTWLITGLRNNTIFGSSLLVAACADLNIATSDITGGYVGLNYIVNAVVHNSGTSAASNFLVRFQSAAGFDDTVLVANIAANSQTTVNYTTPGIIPPFTVTVTADSTSVVNECSRANNSASKSL